MHPRLKTSAKYVAFFLNFGYYLWHATHQAPKKNISLIGQFCNLVKAHITYKPPIHPFSSQNNKIPKRNPDFHEVIYSFASVQIFTPQPYLPPSTHKEKQFLRSTIVLIYLLPSLLPISKTAFSHLYDFTPLLPLSPCSLVLIISRQGKEYLKLIF